VTPNITRASAGVLQVRSSHSLFRLDCSRFTESLAMGETAAGVIRALFMSTV
jgi:hypothetical protein